MKKEGFQQVLSLDKDTRGSSWGHKIKGWWCKNVQKKKRRHQGHRVQKRISPRMLGEILRERTKRTTKGHKDRTVGTSTELWKGQLHRQPDWTKANVLTRNGMPPLRWNMYNGGRVM